MIVKRTVIFILCWILPSLCFGADAGIVWDVSKSMSETHLERVKDWTIRLLVNNSLQIGDGWQRIAPAESNTEFDNLVNNRSLFQQGELILYLPFGELRSKVFPYFSSPAIHKYTTPEKLSGFLNDQLSIKPTDKWTHKILPEWELSEHFRRYGRRLWYLIIVSDFNRDQEVKLSPEQERRVVEWENNQGSFKQEPMIDMSYRQEFRLKIKKVTLIQPAPPGEMKPSESRIFLLSPSPNESLKMDKKKGITFSWSWEGGVTPESYALLVKGTDRKGKVVLSISTQGTSYTYNGRLSSGVYKYQVTALTPDGQSVSSDWSVFKVSSPSSWWIPIALLIVVISAFVFIKQYLLPSIKKKERKEGT